jgi:hypothetical protein
LVDRVHSAPCASPKCGSFEQAARVSRATKVLCSFFHRLIPAFHREFDRGMVRLRRSRGIKADAAARAAAFREVERIAGGRRAILRAVRLYGPLTPSSDTSLSTEARKSSGAAHPSRQGLAAPYRGHAH